MEDFMASTASGGRRRLAFVRGRIADTENGPTRVCHCGDFAPRRTSWTELNPGRRFYGCRNFCQGGGCGFFEWFDEEVGDRSREVLNELLVNAERLHEENMSLRRGVGDANTDFQKELSTIVACMKKNERRLKVALVALVATWVYLFVKMLLG